MAISTGIGLQERVGRFVEDLSNLCFITSLIDDHGVKRIARVSGDFSIVQDYRSFVTRVSGMILIQQCDTVDRHNLGVGVIPSADGDKLAVSDSYHDHCVNEFVKSRAAASPGGSSAIIDHFRRGRVSLICDRPTFGASMDLSCLERYLDLVTGALNEMVADCRGLGNNYDTVYKLEVDRVGIACDFITDLSGLHRASPCCSLTVRSRELTSLAGMPRQLFAFNLFNCTSLESLNGISEVITNSLTISNCPLVRDFAPLRNCKLAQPPTDDVSTRMASQPMHSHEITPNFYLKSIFLSAETALTELRSFRNISAIATALGVDSSVQIKLGALHLGPPPDNAVVTDERRQLVVLSGTLSELLSARAGTGRIGLLAIQRAMNDLGYGEIV